VLKLWNSLNDSSHWYLYRFSPLWILPWTTRCSIKCSDCINCLLQTVHSLISLQNDCACMMLNWLAAKTLSTFSALAFTVVNIHMWTQINCSHATCRPCDGDHCARFCVDCNFSTSVTSVEMELYRYFFFVYHMSEKTSLWHTVIKPADQEGP